MRSDGLFNRESHLNLLRTNLEAIRAFRYGGRQGPIRADTGPVDVAGGGDAGGDAGEAGVRRARPVHRAQRHAHAALRRAGLLRSQRAIFADSV